MTAVSDRLVESALRARDHAYAPYSRYAVGAAILVGADEIVPGANVENASYGLTVCAERIAIFQWISSGRGGELRAIAVAAGPAGSAPSGGRPCGACLQVIREFAENPTIYVVESDGIVETDLRALLPDPFVPPSGAGVTPARPETE